MKIISAVALILTIFPTFVFAAQTGLYAGISAGQSSTSIDNVALSKKTDTGFSFLGGYKVSQNLGIEAQYNSFGKVKMSTASADIHALSATAVVAFPVNTDFSFFGRLGFAKTTFKATGSSTSRNTATFGVGGQYSLDSNLSVRAGWDRYSIDDGATTGNTDLISAGIVYKF